MSAGAGARGNVIYAGGAWAAIDRGGVCEALTRSQKIAPKDKVQAEAGVSFTPDHRRWGEFHVRLSRMPRGDATVMLNIGDQPFLLARAVDWAWSRGPAQAQAIIAALRLRRDDERRKPRSGGRALLRSLSARRRTDRDRCRGGALRASRRWQNPVIAPR